MSVVKINEMCTQKNSISIVVKQLFRPIRLCNIHNKLLILSFFMFSSLGAYYEISRRSNQNLLVYNGVKYFRNRKRGNKQ
jgi:hypothetical protein